MLFNLHSDYVKAAAPRPRPAAEAWAEARRSQPPPGPVRAQIASALARAARRVDRESARRALA
jgi:hypothetical protein